MKPIYLPGILSLVFAIAPILNTAASPDNLATQLKETHFRQQADNRNLSVDIRLGYMDSLIIQNPGQAGEVILKRGTLLNEYGRYPESIKEFDRIISSPVKFSIAEVCQALRFEILISNANHLYKRSTDLAHQLLEMEKPDSLRKFDFHANFLLGELCLSFGEVTKSKKYLDKSIEAFNLAKESLSKEEIKSIQTQIHGMKANIAIFSDNLDEAFQEINAVKRLAGSPHLVNAAKMQMGQLYEIKGEKEIAKKHYTEVLSSKVMDPNVIDALSGIARILLESGDYRQALHLIDSRPDVTGMVTSGYSILNLLRMKGNAQMALGLYREAAETMDKVMELNDSLTDIARKISIADSQEMLNIYDEAEKSKLLEGRLKANSKLLWTLAVAAIAAAGWILWLFLSRRKLEKKAERSLQDKRKAMIDSENNNRELASTTLVMSTVANALREIESACMTDSGSTPEAKIKEIRKILKNVKIEENFWDLFKMFFDRSNQLFFNKLTHAHPDLTNAEIRMCAFMLMNLSTKEIADLTNRSTRTVDTIKFNLRKKLGINEPTLTYLRTIASETEI